jgi:hypothetical protein
MPLFNTTGTIGVILQSGAENVAGSMVGVLYMILFLLIVACIVFGIPLLWIAVIVIPFCLSAASYYSDFIMPLALVLIYLAGALTQHFWIK